MTIVTEIASRQTPPDRQAWDRAEVPINQQSSTPTPGLEERVALTEFRIGTTAHIVVDPSICQGCRTRPCLVACPAGLFVETSEGSILFNYEYCFECGTCDLICSEAGAITWSYPQGGDGVVFRHG